MRVLEITYLMVVPKQLRTQLPPLRRMRVILENILNGSYIICRTQLPPFVFVSRILLYIIMDKNKEDCVTQVENYYCQRLTELVDLKMYDEAHAIFEEFSLGDDESYQWLFIQFEDDSSETLSIEDETNR